MSALSFIDLGYASKSHALAQTVYGDDIVVYTDNGRYSILIYFQFSSVGRCFIIQLELLTTSL